MVAKQKSKSKSSKNLVVFILGILLIAMTIGLIWQQNKISNLEKQHMPQSKFTSYEDCMSNGGALLNTINGQFSACLGGNEDKSGELPQYQAFLQYSAQNLPRIAEAKKSDKENKITAQGTFSSDLIEFLKFDATGCQPRGEYEIVKEVPGRFALMKYGCDGDGQVQSDYPPTIIAVKLGDGWRLLSPTNNMNKTIPSCLLVDMFKISRELSDKCFENTGYDNGKLKDVTYP